MPGLGIWNMTLRSELSICSSLRYSRPERLESTVFRPSCSSRSGLPKAMLSGMTRLNVPSPSFSTVIPWLPNASSWAALYWPAGTTGSNSPWIMLWAR